MIYFRLIKKAIVYYVFP